MVYVCIQKHTFKNTQQNECIKSIASLQVCEEIIVLWTPKGIRAGYIHTDFLYLIVAYVNTNFIAKPVSNMLIVDV